MTPSLDFVDRSEFDAVVIRTDYDDEQAWEVVKKALLDPAGPSEVPSTPCIVEDPAWAGADTDQILAAIAAHDDLSEFLSVVFVADRLTMRAGHHALVAVTTLTREDCADDAEWAAVIEFGREFRTVPLGVHEIHANLELANMDFEEFSAAAHEDPEGVFRSWWADEG